jgi:tetratricopeptide (TPR) repeat protein
MKEKTNILNIKYLVLLIFTVIAFTVYFSSINSSFHFDDTRNISENSDIMVKDLSLTTLNKAAFSNPANLRPVSYFAFALNYYFSGTDTTSYHVTNVIIHIVNAFLIYLIILALFDYGAADDEKKNRLAVSAFFTALFWLVTPLNSQPVIYIVQRMTLLMALFFLLAFFMYLLGRKKKRAVFFILSGIFFVLSVMSKENSVTFPLIIILYELIFVRKGDIKSITKKEKLFLIALSFMLLVPVFVYRADIYKQFLEGGESWDFTMYERLLTQFRVTVFYLSLLILPLPGRLSITHDIVKSTSIFSPITTLLSIIFIIAVFVISVVRMKKSPYLSFAILWLFITLSVEAVMPIEMAYEHRMYLPCIFLIGVFTDFVVNKLYNKNKVPVIAVFLAMAVLFGTLTGVRGRVWENDITLWNDTVKKYPEDGRAWCQLIYGIGRSYYLAGNYNEALRWYNKGLEKYPENTYENIELLFNVGMIYNVQGFNDHAVSYYEKVLAKSKHKGIIYLKTMSNLATVYAITGKYEKAEALFKELISLRPDYGKYHYNFGLFLNDRGRYDDAIKEYLSAIEYDRSIVKAYVDAVRGMLKKGDVKSAEQLCKKYEANLDKLCTGSFIKGMIAEHRRELPKAKEYYKSYLNCKKSKKNASLSSGGSYEKEALKRLKMVSR